MGINLAYIDTMADSALMMIKARDFMQKLCLEKYPAVIGEWKEILLAEMEKTNQKVLPALCNLIEDEPEKVVKLALMAAAIEIIEERFPCAG